MTHPSTGQLCLGLLNPLGNRMSQFLQSPWRSNLGEQVLGPSLASLVSSVIWQNTTPHNTRESTETPQGLIAFTRPQRWEVCRKCREPLPSSGLALGTGAGERRVVCVEPKCSSFTGRTDTNRITDNSLMNAMPWV